MMCMLHVTAELHSFGLKGDLHGIPDNCQDVLFRRGVSHRLQSRLSRSCVGWTPDESAVNRRSASADASASSSSWLKSPAVLLVSVRVIILASRWGTWGGQPLEAA